VWVLSALPWAAVEGRAVALQETGLGLELGLPHP
jgi:hypothetical protein